MKIHSVGILAVALACLTVPTAIYARTADAPSLTYAKFVKTSGIVTFNLRNDSGTSIELKVGEQVMTIEAGKTITVKLPTGARIVFNASTATRQAGSLVAEVSNILDQATIAIR